MSDFLSLAMGTIYGAVVFLIVVRWMKHRRVGGNGSPRHDDAQQNLFEKAAPSDKRDEKREEVAAAAVGHF